MDGNLVEIIALRVMLTVIVTLIESELLDSVLR